MDEIYINKQGYIQRDIYLKELADQNHAVNAANGLPSPFADWKLNILQLFNF